MEGARLLDVDASRSYLLGEISEAEGLRLVTVHRHGRRDSSCLPHEFDTCAVVGQSTLTPFGNPPSMPDVAPVPDSAAALSALSSGAMDDYPAQIADFLEQTAAKIRSLSVDRVRNIATWTAVGMVVGHARRSCS